MMQEEKSRFQYQLANMFWKGDRHSTFQLPTSVGKCRIALIPANHMINKGLVKEKEILIVVPFTPIIEETWIPEIIKWLGEKKLKYFNIQCIRSLHKIKGNTYKYIIADEIEEYLPTDSILRTKLHHGYRFFVDNKIHAIMGLCAEVSRSKLRALRTIAPTMYKMSLEEAFTRGFVSNFNIYLYGVDLTPEERKEYDEINKNIEKYEAKLGGELTAYSNAQTLINSDIDLEKCSPNEKGTFMYAVHYMKNIGKRVNVFNKAHNKIATVHEIIDKYPDKGILFSAHGELANSIAGERPNVIPIHSQLTRSQVRYGLKVFKERPEIQYISAVKSLNFGIHIPKIKFSVFVSGDSTRKALLQRLGRSLSLSDEGESANMIMLYCKNTQEVNWVKSRLFGINRERIKVINNLDKVLCLHNQ